jgi:hypothetical protein
MFITIKAKTLGKYMLVPSILIMIGCMVFMVFLVSRIITTGEYISWTALSAPVAVIVVGFSAFTLYSSIRYIRSRPFRQNRILGYILIGSSLLFLLSSSSIVIFNNITGVNPGGWLHPVIGFIAGSYLSLLGAGLISDNK